METFEQFLNWMLRHPLIGFAIVTAVVSALRSILQPKAKRDAQQDERRNEAPDEDDLEARVRRNFEEMMRRRSAAAAAPAAPVAPAPIARPPRVVDYEEGVRAEPTSTESGRAVEGARVVRAADRRAAKE